MKKITTIIGMALLSLMTYQAQAQDTTSTDGCNSSCSFTYSTNGQGLTTFSGQYFGSVTSPVFTWYVGGNVVGSGQNYSGNVANQTEVCFELEGTSFGWDSITQNQWIDTCYAIYCDFVAIGDTSGGTDSSATSDCGTTSTYTFSTNPNNQTTFVGSYTGTTNPFFFWTVNGVLQAGNTSTFTSNNLVDGDQVCFEVREYIAMWDSTSQWVDTCSAIYCNTFQVASLDEFSNSVISVYPNPSTGLISISSINEAAKLVIMDVQGMVVLTSETFTNIDISYLIQGLYYIQLQGATGEIVSKTERLIKQ